jgi:hypothetical protein
MPAVDPAAGEGLLLLLVGFFSADPPAAALLVLIMASRLFISERTIATTRRLARKPRARF